MKVLSWNCNLKFKDKYQFIKHHDADVLVIQESESLDDIEIEGYKTHWVGVNQKKGLCVLSKLSCVLSNDYSDQFKFVIPIEFNNFNLLGVWSFNHRADKFGKDCSGYLIDALNYYQEWLMKKDKCIVIGDFNHSLVWDIQMKEEYKFAVLNKKLHELGLKSSYHEFNQEQFGSESKSTLYWQKENNKKFHIDYIYQKGFKINEVVLSSYQDTIKQSDHMNLIAELS